MRSQQHPEKLGRYQLSEYLGRGRIFDVYKAKSFGVEGFEKTLVVKRVRPELESNRHFMDAFVTEAQRAVRLSHANVVQVFDLGQADEESGFYMATEYVAGLDFDTLLSRLPVKAGESKLPLCLHVGSEVAKALDHAHRRRDEQLQPLQIVHGAVSARKILISWDGDVKLGDFGATQALLAGNPVPHDDWAAVYAALSPEQAQGQSPTTASDVFTLGVTLHAALTGKHPLLQATGRATLDSVATTRTLSLAETLPTAPDAVVRCIERATAKNPAERPTAAELHEALIAALYVVGSVFGPSDVADVVQPFRRALPSVGNEIDALLARPLTLAPAQPALRGSDRPSLPPLAEFADMRHVSVLALGFQQKTPMQRPQRERALALLERYGAQCVEESARTISAVFGLADADGRDTETAVRAGLVLLRVLGSGSLRPRAAIDVGRVHIAGGSFRSSEPKIKELLESAGRLALTADGNLLVSTRAARSLRRQYSLERSGDGFAVGRARPPGVGDRFVGRRAELQHLAEVLASASHGQLKRIGIFGDLGIGKTRILGEMQRRLGRGQLAMATYVARCPPRGKHLPFSGIAVMLRKLCDVQEGDSTDQLEAVIPRLRALGLDTEAVDSVLSWLAPSHLPQSLTATDNLGRGVSSIFAALGKERFHVFAWDDAQELDASSADLLGRVADRLASQPITLIFSGRDDVDGAHRTLAYDTELRLGELEYEDIARLVALRIGVQTAPEELQAFIWEHAGGHPLFVEELLRALVASGGLEVKDGSVDILDLYADIHLPRSVQAAVSARVRGLPQRARDVFVAAAILDAPVSSVVLAAMLELPQREVDRAIDVLVHRGFVTRDEPDGIGFPTPLFREIVLTELTEEQNADLNRLAAKAYQHVLGDELEEEAERIGYHLAAAGDRDRSADFYATSGLYHLRARHLGRSALDMAYALDLADFQLRGGPQIGNWVRAMTNAIRYVRSGIDLSTFIDRLVERIDAHPQLEARLRVQVLVDIALVMGANHRDRDAEALIAPLVSESERWPDIRRATLTARGELAIQQGDLRTALGVLREARRIGRGDAVEHHRILVALTEAAAGAGEFDEARAAIEQAKFVEPADDLVLACERARVEGILLACEGNWRAAAELCFQTAIQAQEVALLYHVAAGLLGQARAFVRLGELPRAEAAARSARATAEEIGSVKIVHSSDMLLYFVQSTTEDKPSADFLLRSAKEAGDADWYTLEIEGGYLAACLLARTEHADDARRKFSETAALAISKGQNVVAGECHSQLANLQA